MRRAALVLMALALTGCETTAQKSSKLERTAKQEASHRAVTQRGLSITRQSTKVKVLETAVLSDSEAAAAVVTLRNLTATALRDVPIEINVKDATGASTYTNTTPGLAPALTSMPLLPAHSTTIWVNDQVQSSPSPASVSAKVGEGERETQAPPSLTVVGVHLNEGEAEGSLANNSQVSQHELVLYAIARRAGAIVAAGTAIVGAAEAHSSEHFQASLVGSPQGAQLEVSVAGAA